MNRHKQEVSRQAHATNRRHVLPQNAVLKIKKHEKKTVPSVQSSKRLIAWQHPWLDVVSDSGSGGNPLGQKRQQSTTLPKTNIHST